LPVELLRAAQPGEVALTRWRNWLMTPDIGDYLRVIRQLPRPTLAQTERFARFVSGAHSWYKHLPLPPKVPFVFYFDPGAGMSLVRTSTGETALLEITDASTRFHYTWQKTENYRRRLGYWNYHAAYGTSFLFAGEGGVVSTAGAGLNAQAKGRRLGIFKPHEEKAKKAREKERGERFWIEVLGRPVPAIVTEEGIQAVRGSKPIDPDSVRRYLEDSSPLKKASRS